MIDVNATKYRTIAISKFKRLYPSLEVNAQGTALRPKARAVASELTPGKAGEPQSVAGGDGASSPNDGDVPDADDSAERASDFSLGKNDPDLRNSEVSSVSTYASAINGHWQRGVDAFMNVGRLCAEANARLTIAQKSALIQALPFGNTAFSKFAQIGSDTRLYAPEIQVFLPAHYTTLYAVTLLTDEELNRAIADKVLHPDTTRAQLQKWYREQSRKTELAPRPNEAESDTVGAKLPTTPTRDAVQSDALPSALRPEQLAAAPANAPAPEAVAIGSPSTPPPGDDEIPRFWIVAHCPPTISVYTTPSRRAGKVMYCRCGTEPRQSFVSGLLPK